MRRTSPRAARLNSGAGGSGACWRDPRMRMRSWWRRMGESMRVCQVANCGGFLRAEGHDECIEAVAERGCVAGCARRVYLRCAWNGARQRGVLCQWRTFCSLLSSVMAPWSPVELWKGEKKDSMISWITVVSSFWYPEEVGINRRASAYASSLSVLLFSRQKAFWLTYLLDSLVDLLARLGHRMLTWKRNRNVSHKDVFQSFLKLNVNIGRKWLTVVVYMCQQEGIHFNSVNIHRIYHQHSATKNEASRTCRNPAFSI